MQIELLSQKQIFVSVKNTQSINTGILNSYGLKGNSLNWVGNNNSTSSWIKFNSITKVSLNSFSFNFSGLTPNFTISTSLDNINWNTVYIGNTVPTAQNYNIPFIFLKFEIINTTGFILENFYINVTDYNDYPILYLSYLNTMLVPKSISTSNSVFDNIAISYLKMWEDNTQDSILMMDPNYTLNIYSTILNNRIGGIDVYPIDGEVI